MTTVPSQFEAQHLLTSTSLLQDLDVGDFEASLRRYLDYAYVSNDDLRPSESFTTTDDVQSRRNSHSHSRHLPSTGRVLVNENHQCGYQNEIEAQTEEAHVTRSISACSKCGRGTSRNEKGQVLSSSTFDSPCVTWSSPSDPAKPLNWTPGRRWTIVIMNSMMSFVVSFGSSVFSPCIPSTAAEFSVSTTTMALGVALYVAGFAFGPLIWGPASEAYGRTIPLWIGHFAFVIFQIPLGVAQNLETIFISRFFAGLFGCAPISILPGMCADFCNVVERGIAVSMFSACVFCGPGFGPIIGSYVTESHLGWRSTAWITMILGAIFAVGSYVVTPETYEPTLLRRKAQKLRSETQNFALHAKCEEELLDMRMFVMRYITKPAKMLVKEPILTILTVYSSLVYGILYLTFTSFPIAFTTVRGWSLSTGSLPFIALLIGILIACFIILLHSKVYVGKRHFATGVLNPEDRLPPMILGSIMLPVGLFWFGWTSDPSIHWSAQVLAAVPIGCGIILVFMSITVYLVDVYLTQANSANAANVFVRSLVAASFPVWSIQMFDALHVDWAMSTLGFVCVALAPFPVLFWKYGKRIRSWSKSNETV